MMNKFANLDCAKSQVSKPEPIPFRTDAMNTDLIPRYRILRRLQINYWRTSTDATVFNSSIIQLDSQFYSQFSWQPQGGMSFERPLCPGGGLPSSVYDSVEPI